MTYTINSMIRKGISYHGSDFIAICAAPFHRNTLSFHIVESSTGLDNHELWRNLWG